MDTRLSFARGQGGQSMGIQITQAQQALKKQHGRSPHCWAAPKPWQDLFAQQGLHLKQQKRTGKNR
jgi:hypothetical protein